MGTFLFFFSEGSIMERLLPCPFCDHSAFLESNDNKGDIVYRIRCSNINCGTKPSTETFKRLNRVTEIWNTRNNNESFPFSFLAAGVIVV